MKGGCVTYVVQENLMKLSKKLLTKNMNPLRFVVDDLGLTVEPDPIQLVRFTTVRDVDGSMQERPIITKKDLITALIQWVSTM